MIETNRFFSAEKWGQGSQGGYKKGPNGDMKMSIKSESSMGVVPLPTKHHPPPLFATFQCWLQLVVFHLKGAFLSIFVLILIIFNQSL